MLAVDGCSTAWFLRRFKYESGTNPDYALNSAAGRQR